jgi:hypothetical protein
VEISSGVDALQGLTQLQLLVLDIFTLVSSSCRCSGGSSSRLELLQLSRGQGLTKLVPA